jgi:hypothetical protein
MIGVAAAEITMKRTAQLVLSRWPTHCHRHLLLQRPSGVAKYSPSNHCRRSHINWQEPMQEQLYLHIAPCGDHWQSPAIFAAKHMTEGYVKSFPIPADFCTDHLDEAVFQAAYDSGVLPSALLKDSVAAGTIGSITTDSKYRSKH